MTDNPLSGWIGRHLPFARKPEMRQSGSLRNRGAESGGKPDFSGRTPPSNPGFSEDALQGLRELEARSVPAGVEARSAYAPSYTRTDRLSPENAAGGGLVSDDQGNQRPHYHGHRERLRQRFLRGGHEPMPEYELLELVLFNAIERIDVKPLAKRLLAEFGDLSGVVSASEHRLSKVEGSTDKVFVQLKIAEAMAQRMAKAKAFQRDVVSSWDALIAYCRTAMAHRDTEQFRVLYLDRKNKVIGDEAQASGTVDHVPVYPREVAKRALELNASAIILVHNHPSGDTTPSQPDISMTEQIEAACHTIGVTVHDHVIIGRETDFSFRANGLMI